MTNEPENARLAYSVKEAAKTISVSERTIHRLLNDGSLTTIKLGGRTLIPHHSIVALLAKSEVQKVTA